MNLATNLNCVFTHFLFGVLTGFICLLWIDHSTFEEYAPITKVFVHSLKLSGSRPSNLFLVRRCDSFIVNNNYRNHLNNCKIRKTTPKYDMGRKISQEERGRSALYAFGFLKNWFGNELTGWYVPPMPVGERASARLRKIGPLQTDEETLMLFKLLGLSPDATTEEIGYAYETALDSVPEDVQDNLKKMFEEYVRKEVIELFEHMESHMDKGPEAWKEFWNPNKDLFGNPITKSEEEAEKEGREFLKRIFPNVKADKFIEYWDKQNSKYNRVMNAIDLPTLIRFSQNKKDKFFKCLMTMVPVMFAGLFPKFSSLSTAVEALFASKFIYSGDPSQNKDEDYSKPEIVHPSQNKKRSTSMKSLVTLLVIFIHSMIGLSVSTLIQLYTGISDFISPQLLNTAFINFHIIIAAILYDASDLPFTEQMRINEERFSSINDVIDIIQE